MIRKILVPIDGSETARKPLQYAVDLAKKTESTTLLLRADRQREEEELEGGKKEVDKLLKK